MATISVRSLSAPQAAPELPAGFVLDQAPAPAAGGLPEGFVLDQPGAPVGDGDQSAPSPSGNPLLDAVVQGLTFGFSDEIQGALRSLTTGKPYTETVEESRRGLESFREQHPIASTVAEIGGAVLVPGGALLRAPTMAARALRGAGVGAAGGGVYGAGTGTTPQERAERAASGALVGGAIGGALGPFASSGAPAQRLAGTTATGPQAVAAAESLGVQIPRIAATESIPAKRIGLTASKVPWGGTPIQTSIEQASQDIGKRAGRVAEDFAGGASAAGRPEAGSAFRAGITDYIGPVTSARVTKAYDAVDRLVNKNILSPLTATARVANEIVAERGEAALRGSGTAVDRITDALARPNGLTYEGIKRLRTSIREMMDSGMLPADISGAELKRIYSALSDDLRASVQRAGGQRALQAFERANKYNSLVARRREELAKMLGTKSDETLFDTVLRMASAKGGANIDLLMKARKAVQPDEWDEVASAVIARLGQAQKGNIETFSPQRFLTEYGNITQHGKAILFGSTGKTELRKALDDIQKVSERLADLGQYANPSGTAQMGIGTAFGAIGFAEAAFTGGLPLTTMAGLLGTRFVATVLSKPVTARSMANWSKAFEIAVRKPSRGTLAAFNAVSRRFAADAGEALGLRAHVHQIADALQGAVPSNANNQRQE